MCIFILLFSCIAHVVFCTKVVVHTKQCINLFHKLYSSGIYLIRTSLTDKKSSQIYSFIQKEWEIISKRLFVCMSFPVMGNVCPSILSLPILFEGSVVGTISMADSLQTPTRTTNPILSIWKRLIAKKKRDFAIWLIARSCCILTKAVNTTRIYAKVHIWKKVTSLLL